MNFGDQLKQARLRAGYTQKQFAEKLNMVPQNLSQYESGARNPSKKKVKLFATALNVGYSYSETGEPYLYGISMDANCKSSRICENCAFDSKGMDEHPCAECSERYELKFRPKPEEPEIKPCPFCGDEAEIIAFSESYKIKCENPTCKTKPSTRWFSHEKEAIKAWNTRKGE